MKKTLLVCFALWMLFSAIPAAADKSYGQLTDATLPEGALYNGIVLSENAFSVDANEGDPVTVPYLVSAAQGGYAPELVNIDRGRQLLVDDFLIESTTLSRRFYKAYENPSNPVFAPETEWELTAHPSTACTSGGIWYDMEERIYKMWYEAGFNNRMAYATSEDGIHWDRPAINSDGSNTLVRQQQTDSFSVWIDYEADPLERYKLMIRSPNIPSENKYSLPATVYTSANGINWSRKGETGTMLDRSTFFYNPFSELWVFSIRGQKTVKWANQSYRPRLRLYHANENFLAASRWEEDDPLLWLKPDSDDLRDPTINNDIPELYNFDSIAYESLMIGFHQMFYGPQNDVTQSTGNPKITEIQLGYSRDGFHYDRPDRSSLISASRTEGTWNYGYLQTCTGGLIVYDDEIRIYYSAFSGDMTVNGVPYQGAYLGGAVGYASLRRDGFASMNGTGELLTKPLTVTKDVKYLFVNADSSRGSLRAEVLDANGLPLEGYGIEDCVAVSENACKIRMEWKDGKTLEQLQGKAFRLRFVMENGELYSFWLSPDEAGESGGEVGAGYVSANAPAPSPTVTEPITSQPASVEEKGCGSIVRGAWVLLAPVALLLRKRKRED